MLPELKLLHNISKLTFAMEKMSSRYIGTANQVVRERARVFETLYFFKRPNVAQYCARFTATQ